MLVTFKNVLVLSVRSGVSKKGLPYSSMQFLDSEDAEVFEVMAFGEKADSLASLEPKTTINAISFELQPTNRDGHSGVRLVPAW